MHIYIYIIHQVTWKTHDSTLKPPLKTAVSRFNLSVRFDETLSIINTSCVNIDQRWNKVHRVGIAIIVFNILSTLTVCFQGHFVYCSNFNSSILTMK